MTMTPQPPTQDGLSSPVHSAAATSDRAWVEAAQQGDVSAFEQLYRMHCGRVYALCLRLCGEASEAEEMCQESFVRAWQKLDTYRGGSAFSSWLHRLTVNVVLGSWRAKGRYRQRVVSLGEASDLEEPAAERRRVGLAVDLERAVAALPRGARTVFVLHDVEGLLHREIAQLTGLAVGTCKTQLHRARKLLRSSFEGEAQ
ncbi:MAG: RNA polymerase sigma factor [Acidobacteriota bacterium]